MLQHVTDEQRRRAGWIGGEGVRLLSDGALAPCTGNHHPRPRARNPPSQPVVVKLLSVFFFLFIYFRSLFCTVTRSCRVRTRTKVTAVVGWASGSCGAATGCWTCHVGRPRSRRQISLVEHWVRGSIRPVRRDFGRASMGCRLGTDVTMANLVPRSGASPLCGGLWGTSWAKSMGRR
jgi:hypothetical protein